jgi:hypothetical protein
VSANPNKVSADKDPKGVVANYRNFNKDSYDGSSSQHDRGHAPEVHLAEFRSITYL